MTATPKHADPQAPQASAEAGAAASIEVSSAMRQAAEAGLTQMKDAYDSCRSLAEDATGLFEESFAKVNGGVTALQAKALEAGRKNVDAGFDFATGMLTARSLAEAFELQTRFAREQLDAMSQQMREFQELTVKMQVDAAKPFREGMTKAATQFQRGS